MENEKRAASLSVNGTHYEVLLHPLQKAFIEFDGFQCGYVSPDRGVRPSQEPVAHVGRWSLSIQRSEGI